MARKKLSEAALKRLEEKGVTVKVIKKGEEPKPVNAPVAKKAVQNAAPKAKLDNKNLKPKQWTLEVDDRDWQGLIKSLTITEV